MAVVICNPGPETVDGTDVADRISARAGNDTIRSLSGNDRVFGDGGRDTIIGGTGNDVLTGDGNANQHYQDVFVFGSGSGRDVVTDFDISRDFLQIQKGLNGIKNAKDVLDHATQKGGNVVIDLGDGNRIILKNVDFDDLKKDPAAHFDITRDVAV